MQFKTKRSAMTRLLLYIHASIEEGMAMDCRALLFPSV